MLIQVSYFFQASQEVNHKGRFTKLGDFCPPVEQYVRQSDNHSGGDG